MQSTPIFPSEEDLQRARETIKRLKRIRPLDEEGRQQLRAARAIRRRSGKIQGLLRTALGVGFLIFGTAGIYHDRDESTQNHQTAAINSAETAGAPGIAETANSASPVLPDNPDKSAIDEENKCIMGSIDREVGQCLDNQ
jgi:hypothetical protein